MISNLFYSVFINVQRQLLVVISSRSTAILEVNFYTNITFQYWKLAK